MQRLLLPPSASATPLRMWRLAVLYGGIVLFVLTQLPLAIPDVFDQTAHQIGLNRTWFTVLNVAMLAAIALALVLARRGDISASAVILVSLLSLEGMLLLLGEQWDTPRGWIALWGAIAVANLCFAWRASAAATFFALGVITTAIFRDFGDLSASNQAQRFAAYVAALMWSLALASLTHIVQRNMRRAFQSRSRHDSSHFLIEIGEEIARGLFAREELGSFLGKIATAIENRFENIYHVQIYVIEDESEQAVLHAATGPVGEQLLDQEYEVDVGGLSVVGRVTISGEYLLIADFAHTPVHKPQPFLPHTRCELAIPLMVDERIIGALDVQSLEANSLDETDIITLRATANQIAIAVDSLQLYDSVRRSTRENQALYQQTQANLREIERLNFQITGRAWSDYLRQQAESAAITLDFSQGQEVSEADWTPTLNESAANQRVITTLHNGQRIVAMPIRVGSETVGAMEFELDTSDVLPDGMLEMIEAVSQRLGLAMENRRLFDETQRTAQREAMINDIGADLQAASGVGAIMQKAARHLREALAAQQVTICLGAPLKEREKTQP
jgi:GAF domain-containing protein